MLKYGTKHERAKRLPSANLRYCACQQGTALIVLHRAVLYPSAFLVQRQHCLAFQCSQ
jgi:hypothetical protein